MEGKMKEKSDLRDLICSAIKATYNTRSLGGVERCVDILHRLKSLSLSVKDIDQSLESITKLETLRSHRSPKIRKEAVALFHSWLKTIYTQRRHNSFIQKEKKIDLIKPINLKRRPVTSHDATMKKKTDLETAGNKKMCSLTTKQHTEPVVKDSTNPKSAVALTNKKREILDLFEAAKKAADLANAKGILSGKAEASRCVKALSLLMKIKITPKPTEQWKRMMERLERLTEHKDRKICHAASALLQIWTQKKAKETDRKGSTTNTFPNFRRRHG